MVSPCSEGGRQQRCPRSGRPWRRVLEGLVSRHVTELLLQKAMDLLDGEVAVGVEDMEAAGEDKLLIFVGGDATSLEVHH